MKRLYEGTEEQFNNLDSALLYSSNDLPVELKDRCLEGLWTTDVVKHDYYCSDKDAESLLERTMCNEGTVGDFRERMHILADKEPSKYCEKTNNYEVLELDSVTHIKNIEGETLAVVIDSDNILFKHSLQDKELMYLAKSVAK